MNGRGRIPLLKEKRKLRPAAVLPLLVYPFMLWLNLSTGMSADDYLFSFDLSDYGYVFGLGDIFSSLAVLRRAYNGRVFAHFFVQLFLLLPRWVFTLVNSLCPCAILYILYRYIRRDEKRDLALLLFCAGAVWLLLPAWGQVFLWLTGACNYSWSIALSLLFLCPYFAAWLERDLPRPQRATARAAFLLLALLAGGYSENGSLAMLLTAFCLLALLYRRERRLDAFLSAAFLVSCAGFLFLMLAPSELGGRRGAAAESSVAHGLSRLLDKAGALLGAPLPGWLPWAALGLGLLLVLGLALLCLRRRTLGCALSGALVLAAAAFLTVVLLPRPLQPGLAGRAAALLNQVELSLLWAFSLYALLFLLAFARQADSRVLLAAAVLGLAAFASLAVFLFAAYFPARSACPAIFLTVLADALLLDALGELGRTRPTALLAGAAVLLMLLSMSFALPDILRSGAALRQRHRTLDQARSAGVTEIQIPAIPVLTKYSAHWPGDQPYFDNDLCMFYGFDRLSIQSHVNERGESA